MPEIQIKLPADEALHARMAAWIVKSIQHFEAEVTIIHRNKAANAQSVLGLLTLGAEAGAVITVRAHGSDAEQVTLLLREKLGNAASDSSQNRRCVKSRERDFSLSSNKIATGLKELRRSME